MMQQRIKNELNILPLEFASEVNGNCVAIVNLNTGNGYLFECDRYPFSYPVVKIFRSDLSSMAKYSRSNNNGYFMICNNNQISTSYFDEWTPAIQFIDIINYIESEIIIFEQSTKEASPISKKSKRKLIGV
jgi:hypothetical protein